MGAGCLLVAGCLTYLSGYAAMRINCFPGFYSESYKDRCLVRCYPSSLLSGYIVKWPIPLMRAEGYLTGRRMDFLRNYEMLTVCERN